MYLLGGILSLAATVITIATLYQIMNDLRDRDEERIQRAWTHLLTKNGGRTGKGEALQTLIDLGADIEGINLSCENVGYWRDNDCETSPILSNFSLPTDRDFLSERRRYENDSDRSEIDAGFQQIIPIDFTQAEIMAADLSLIEMRSRYYMGAKISDSNMSETWLIDLLVGTSIVYSDLQNSLIDVENLPNISGSNITDAAIGFTRANQLHKDSPGIAPHISYNLGMIGKYNWFWADKPPTYVVGSYPEYQGTSNPVWEIVFSNRVFICDPRFRSPREGSIWQSLVNYFSPPKVNLGERRPFLVSDNVVEGSPWFRSQSVTYVDGKPSSRLCPRLTVGESAALYPDRYRP